MSIPVLQKYADSCRDAILNKDNHNISRENWAINLLQAADCTEIVRCANIKNFKPNNLNFVRLGLITEDEGRQLAQTNQKFIDNTPGGYADSRGAVGDDLSHYRDDNYSYENFATLMAQAARTSGMYW
jgi:hypothetical protein